MYTHRLELKDKVMATKLTKPKEIILPNCNVRDVGKLKPLVLTIYPTGDYVLRPKGTRKGGDAQINGSLATDYTEKMWRKCR